MANIGNLKIILFMISSSFVMSKDKLYLGGLFPIGEGWFHSLGNQCYAAALLAVDHVNNSTDVLPNHQLVTIFNDTGGSSGIALRAVFDYLYRRPAVVAIIGALFSGPSVSVAEVAGLWNLIQIAYASTTPNLSNRKKFPYFFRTISSANDFIPVQIEMLKKFSWQRVATLNENNEPFASVTNNLISGLKAANMTIVATESFNSDPTEAILKLKTKDARIIIGNFFESQAKKVFCECFKAGLFGPQYVWVINGYYTPGWWDNPATPVTCTRGEMLEAIEGYLTVVWSMMNQNDHQRTISGLTPLEFRTVLNNQVGETVFVPGHQVPAANSYDAVWTVAIALHNAFNKTPELNLTTYNYDKATSDILFKEIQDLQFDGVSGPVSYRKTGDRSSTLLVEQFHNGTERTIGLFVNLDGTLDWIETNQQIWRRTGGSPPLDADNTRIVEEIMHISSILFYIYSVMAVMGVFLALGFLVFNIYFRHRRVIKMSSPYLNNLIIGGCIGAYVTVILSGMDTLLLGNTAFVRLCQAVPWVLSLCFTLSFGSMFAKTWRVYTIFTNKSMKRKAIKDRSLFVMVALFAAIDTIILLSEQLVDPPRLSTTSLPEQVSEEAHVFIQPVLYSCVADNTLYWTVATYAWKGTLLVFGIFLAWQTKGVRLSGLNDSRYIGICIYNVVIFSAVGAPLHQMLRQEVTYRFAIIGAFLLFCTTLTLGMVFLPKVFSLYRGESGAENRGEASLASVTNARGSQVAPISTVN